MKVLVLLSVLVFSSSSLWAVNTASFTSFFPAGTQASLEGAQGTVSLVSGETVSLEAGNYTVQLRHPDFEPLVRNLHLDAGQEMVLLPRLTSSAAYRNNQLAKLRDQQDRARAAKAEVLTAAVVTGISALAGWGTVAALEWSLAQKKADLALAQADYRAASSSEAPGLWAGIETRKADITSFRNYEIYVASTAGVLTAGGLALLFLGPDSKDWDGAIGLMAGRPLN